MDHDVYVLIPGITGSVLEKDGRDVFGLTAEAGLRALFTAGHSLDALRLVDDPEDVDDLGDGVSATRLAADAHLVPGLWKIDGYGKVGQFLRRRLRLVAGESYVEFPYDWRRDNRVAARRLAAAAKQWLAARRATHPDAKLVLVAHSMGGLVARYYIEVLDGWRDTRTLVTFGTPYRGSLNALGFLAAGYTKLFGLVDLTDLMRSFTSVHQLLPIYPCLDRGDGNLVKLTEAAGVVPGLDPAQVAAARQFHAEIEDAVDRHRNDAGYSDNRYRICPVVGIEQPTNQSAAWSGGRLTMLPTNEGGDLGGDGTVPRVAAFPQEAENEHGAMFASARHASLQNTDAVLTQLRGWMTSPDLSHFRTGGPVSLALDIDDLYPAGTPVRVGVRPSSVTGDLNLLLEWVAGPGQPPEVTTLTMALRDGPREADIPPPPPGCYRVTVSGDNAVEPVSDLLVVAPR